MFRSIFVLLIYLMANYKETNKTAAVVESVTFSPKTSNPIISKLLIVSFDGFRYDYVNPLFAPNLYKSMINEATTAHMFPTFATKTFPNHHSISTGLYQQSHGILHNEMFDPDLNEAFDDFSDKWWANERARPIYIVNQMYHTRRSSCCAPWPGCHARYKGGSEQTRYFRLFNESAIWSEQLEWILTKFIHQDTNLGLLYIHQPDRAGHTAGPFGKPTLDQVRRVDNFFRHLQTRLIELGLRNSLNQLVLSDHGLAEIHPNKAIVLEALLNASWYHAYGGDPIYHIQPLPGYSASVGQALRILDKVQGHFKVYHKTELPARYRYANNRRVHEYVLVANEGWSIYATYDELQRNKKKRGQHGYDNLTPSMRPLFLALGPSFRSGYHHPIPFTNVDLYPLMLRLLNIAPSFAQNHEGDFQLVKDMLNFETN